MSRPRWLPWVAGLATIGLAISLGNWQTRRAAEREAAQAHIDAANSSAPIRLKGAADVDAIASDLPRRVSLEGDFVDEATIYLENRIVDGIAGFRVVTPLRIAPTAPLVLIERGWIARDPADRGRIAAVAPRGTIAIEGIAVARLPRVLELGAPSHDSGRIWQNLDYARFEKVTGQRIAPIVIEQTNEATDGLRRVRPRADAGADRNRAYALQWYAIATGVALLTAFYGLRHWRKAGTQRNAD